MDSSLEVIPCIICEAKPQTVMRYCTDCCGYHLAAIKINTNLAVSMRKDDIGKGFDLYKIQIRQLFGSIVLFIHRTYDIDRLASVIDKAEPILSVVPDEIDKLFNLEEVIKRMKEIHNEVTAELKRLVGDRLAVSEFHDTSNNKVTTDKLFVEYIHDNFMVGSPLLDG